MSVPTSNTGTSHGDTNASWRMHIAVAQMAYEKGLFTAAVRNYRTALAIAQNLNLHDQDISVGLVGLAKCYCELGNFTEAEALYNRVLDIDRATLSDGCSTLAADLNDLATLYLRTNRLGEAEAILKKSLAISTASDQHSIELARAEKSLAYLYCQSGRLQDAERMINHALSICDTSAGRQTKVFAEVLIVLALVTSKNGSLSQAEELIERAIASFELLTGGQHPELARFLDMAVEIFNLEDGQGKVNELTARAKTIRNSIRVIDH